MQDYLLGDEVVKSGDPNNTRVNEVMEGREKRIFDAAVDYRAGKDVDLTKFFGGVHSEFIVDVAMSLAFDLAQALSGHGGEQRCCGEPALRCHGGSSRLHHRPWSGARACG